MGKIAEIDLPADCSPSIRVFVDYWRSVRPADGLPGRQHIDPAEITAMLPGVWLVDVATVPLRFRYRLVGSKLVEFFGHDPTGRWLDEVFDLFPKSATNEDFKSIVAERRGLWRRGKPRLVYEKEFKLLERIFLPLAANGTDVDMLFCLTVIFDEAERHC